MARLQLKTLKGMQETGCWAKEGRRTVNDFEKEKQKTLVYEKK